MRLRMYQSVALEYAFAPEAIKKRSAQEILLTMVSQIQMPEFFYTQSPGISRKMTLSNSVKNMIIELNTKMLSDSHFTNDNSFQGLLL